MGNTYGTWLPGDGRGWRERHHRKHVQGDYKHPPPPGSGDALYAWMKANMKRDAVSLSRDQRQVACDAIAEALLHYQVELTALCVAAVHVHVLARFTPEGVDPRLHSPIKLPPQQMKGAVAEDPVPRLVFGKAKSWCTRKLKQAGHFTERDGGLWAVRCKVAPVESATHFNYLKHEYIPSHAKQGAVIWTPKPRVS